LYVGSLNGKKSWKRNEKEKRKRMEDLEHQLRSACKDGDIDQVKQFLTNP